METTPNKNRWLVVAVYDDNKQRWADSFHTETPLEAQVLAQMDRLADGGAVTAISVSGVVDRQTGDIADAESYAADTRLLPMPDALAKVIELAQLSRPTHGASPLAKAGLELWSGVALGSSSFALALKGDLDNLATDEAYRSGLFRSAARVAFVDSGGVLRNLDAASSLRTVVDLAATCVDLTDMDEPMSSGVFQIHQMRAFLDYFQDRLAAIFENKTLSSADLGA